MTQDHSKETNLTKSFNQLIEKKSLSKMETTLQVVEVLESNIVARNITHSGVKLGQLFITKDGKQIFEVVKSAEESSLMPLSGTVTVEPGEKLEHYPDRIHQTFRTESLLGRVVDALGNPLDDLGDIYAEPSERSGGFESINPLKRKKIKEIVTTGIKSIDALLTLGRGQRIGIMAGSGVGKTTTLGMIAKHSSEEVNVIALVGERGREVREFIENDLGEEGLERSVVVVATSEETPLLQMRAAEFAAKIATDFREEGKNVMLLMDSVTRYLQARRSIDIANGDIPMMGGRTNSMEPSIQRMFESAGNSDVGSITGIYTILVEGEDFDSPIPDMARGILDGHIVLRRRLANLNHYPAIDVLESISRVMQDIVPEEDLKLANEVKKYLSIYKENESQISLGLIQEGASEDLDLAIQLKEDIDEFLRQDESEQFDREESIKKMAQLFNRPKESEFND